MLFLNNIFLSNMLIPPYSFNSPFLLRYTIFNKCIFPPHLSHFSGSLPVYSFRLFRHENGLIKYFTTSPNFSIAVYAAFFDLLECIPKYLTILKFLSGMCFITLCINSFLSINTVFLIPSRSYTNVTFSVS